MIRLRPSGVDEILIKRVQDWYEPGPGVFIQSLKASFSPAMLFTGSTTGAWYDPSDYSTLFQNAAGTTPVTAVEQPVGLMLDKSKGLVLGPELVANPGPFINTTNWTAVSSVLSTASGDLVITGNGTGYPAARTTIATVVGVTYKLRFVANQISSGNATNIWIGTSAGGSQLFQKLVSTPSETVAYFTATGTTTHIQIVNNLQTASDLAAVGIASVRELPGNHAFNSSGNSANFPVLSARYNLLTQTEDISASDWAAYTIASRTATKFIPNTVGSEHYIANSTSKTASAIQYAARFDVKDEGYGFSPIVVGDWNGTSASNGWYFCINLSDGSYTSPLTFGSGWAAGTVNITRNSGTGICTVSLVFTTSAVSARIGIGIYAYPSLKAASPFSFAGDGTSGIYCSKIDLRVANDALGQPAYQRVNTSTDYDTVGFKPYLRFNGTNQWLQTNSIDFTYGDKMFVSAGVRKLSDASIGTILETGVNTATVNGSLMLTSAGQSFAGAKYGSALRGTNLTYSDTSASYAAPLTSLVSLVNNIAQSTAATEQVMRINGVDVALTIAGANAGTGNFGNYPLYIGAREGTSLWFNGRLYGMVVAGKQASAAEITSTETYLNQKTGAYA